MDDVKSKQMNLINELINICDGLNWVIGLPLAKETTGLIIGNTKYVSENCEKVYGNGNFEIISKESAEKKIKDREELATSDNVNDFELIEMNEEEFLKFIETGDLPDNPRIISSEKPTTIH